MSPYVYTWGLETLVDMSFEVCEPVSRYVVVFDTWVPYLHVNISICTGILLCVYIKSTMSVCVDTVNVHLYL